MANEKNLKPNSERTPRERKELAKKAGKASGVSRRRHKTMQETVLMILKQPMDDIGLNNAKRAGVDLSGIDEYDLTAMTGMILGQVRAAAHGNSQAAQVVADWMDLATKHKKDQLEIEKLKAEIERLRAGQDSADDDQVLQFIEGMKHDKPDT